VLDEARKFPGAKKVESLLRGRKFEFRIEILVSAIRNQPTNEEQDIVVEILGLGKIEDKIRSISEAGFGVRRRAIQRDAIYDIPNL
jgi:hypothetical protein